MKGKVLRWVFVLSLIMASGTVFAQSEKQPGFIFAYGGCDMMGCWPLTDESLDTLENGDDVMIVWVGPDGAVDPPVMAMGSPLNGQPTGDDVEIEDDEGFVDFGLFFITIDTWHPNSTDSLGRQRHPAIGEKFYLRVFNAGDLKDATYYGESNIHEVVGGIGEDFFVELPNDPTGPTTDTEIFGKFLKIIGGIDPATGQSYKLRDPSSDLDDDDVAQLIWIGPDGEKDTPDPVSHMPGDDDVLVDSWGVNEGMYPSTGTSVFKRFSASFDTSSHGLPALGQDVYVRLLNSDNPLQATYYGDSPTFTIAYEVGESLSVFTDDAVDCDTEFPPQDIRDFTIYGGLDTTDFSYWPLVDVYGLRLKDDDLLQLIWAGPDETVDEMDESTGQPTGDDSTLATWGIGEGYAGVGTGRFKKQLYTYETHTKVGYPAQGDVLYLRVFDDATIGDDAMSQRYGESETYTVQWAFNEVWYAFPDSVFDAAMRVPWYRTLKIYAGTDTADTEYPLTDSSGTQLEDGDLVQIIWAGADDTVDPIGTTDCMPTGDDSLWAEMAIGEGYSADSGLFKTELQTFKTLHPGEGDVLYLRVFNGSVYHDATHYGESEPHTVAYMQGETYHPFADADDDCVIPNPCFTSVEEWENPSATVPATYALHQNYPNPFNPETDIRYQIPEGEHVQLTVYNVLGQKISGLVDGYRAAGSYTVRWLGTDQSGRSLGSGIYFYTLRAGNFSETRKMVLMK